MTFALLLATLVCPDDNGWVAQRSGTIARLRGLAVVTDEVAWASGAEGTVLRTIDGGKNWDQSPVPGAERLDFRDIHAFDDWSALILAIGPAGQARVYATGDGRGVWTLRYEYPDARGFLDAIAMFDDRRGLILGDPVEGRFTILATEDSGTSWRQVAPQGMPPAREGEGAFAASGTCLVTYGGRHAWFCTGGAGVARVFRSRDGGLIWDVSEAPIHADGPAAGGFSLAFRDERNGILVGGDYQRPELAENVAAWTLDGGRTWNPAKTGPGGYRSAVAFVPGREEMAVAVGPTGADLTEDGGRTWRPLPGGGFDAVDVCRDGVGWAVGEGGRIGRWQVPDP